MCIPVENLFCMWRTALLNLTNSSQKWQSSFLCFYYWHIHTLTISNQEHRIWILHGEDILLYSLLNTVIKRICLDKFLSELDIDKVYNVLCIEIWEARTFVKYILSKSKCYLTIVYWCISEADLGSTCTVFGTATDQCKTTFASCVSNSCKCGANYYQSAANVCTSS